MNEILLETNDAVLQETGDFLLLDELPAQASAVKSINGIT